ncbi:hypothetical protein XELAEV_18030551mg [Xenopus laevis]|uniref:Uncharacterized protein n=1 Tax=Xenopus laevis TaxID=8355 RepID=A0A974CM54_XENLA|nr:hypothetical protein XELAEV_18030551mg [Xenopus laevis]
MVGLWVILVLLSLTVPPNTDALTMDNNRIEQIRAAAQRGIRKCHKERGRKFALYNITSVSAKAQSDAEVVHFLIKETNCKKSKKKKVENCAFKDSGKVKCCSLVMSGKEDIIVKKKVKCCSLVMSGKEDIIFRKTAARACGIPLRECLKPGSCSAI